jgi:hypothetical protein
VRVLQGGNSPDRVSVVACTDDYEWWSRHGNAPSAGKPVWITRDARAEHHHIFFDDNIHNKANDSIVAVRARDTSGAPFQPLSGEDTLKQHGVHLVRTPTVEPILNENWFVEQIDAAEARLAALGV